MSKETQNLVGGWSPFYQLTRQTQAVFEEAAEGNTGAHYAPNSVATQIVEEGTNYRFKCTASLPLTEVIWSAIVEIFKPLHEKPYITGILRT